MQDGNGEVAASDLLSFLLLCFICWGIYTVETFPRCSMKLPTPHHSLKLRCTLRPLQGGDEQLRTPQGLLTTRKFEIER